MCIKFPQVGKDKETKIMVNDIFNGVFRLLLLVMVLIILFMWSTHMLSANVLMLPTIVIALIGLLTAKPFK